MAVEEEIVEETIEGDEEEKDGALEVEKEMRKEIEEEEDLYREKGWWRHKVTDEPLGGTEGRIEFTIVGSVFDRHRSVHQTSDPYLS